MVVDVGRRKVARLAALQEWEGALCAYELAAAPFFAAGYLAPDAHQPAPDHALDRGAHCLGNWAAERAPAELHLDVTRLPERGRQRRELLGRLLPRQDLLAFQLHVRHDRLLVLLRVRHPFVRSPGRTRRPPRVT